MSEAAALLEAAEDSRLQAYIVLCLLARRAAGGPAPALAGAPPPGATESTRAPALLAAGLILPVLDGLDEIPDRVRARPSAGSTTRCDPESRSW